jgi:uridine kinase
VAGPSGAGKSTASQVLASKLSCAVLSLDNFYRDKGDIPVEDIDGEAVPQWDCPEAFDLSLAMTCIRVALMSGCSEIAIPDYSFELDRRVSLQPLPIPSNDYLVVDGTLSHLLQPGCAAEDLSLITVYVHAERDERIRRIRMRSLEKPRRTLESERKFDMRISAMLRGEIRWVLPQATKADFTVHAT